LRYIPLTSDAKLAELGEWVDEFSSLGYAGDQLSLPVACGSIVDAQLAECVTSPTNRDEMAEKICARYEKIRGVLQVISEK
jgi:hypothetical protein